MTMRVYFVSYLICICFYKSVMSDFFDLITPKYVPDNVKLFQSDNNFKNRTTWIDTSQKSWYSHIDAHMKNALQECLFFKKKNKYFTDLHKCLMNCSASCKRMKYEFLPQCVSVKLGWANSFKDNYPPLRKSSIVGRHIISPTSCPVTYPDSLIMVYFKLLMSVWYEFEVDKSLRLNLTFLHFDIAHKELCVWLENIRDCNLESLVFVHIINRPVRSRTSFKVSM